MKTLILIISLCLFVVSYGQNIKTLNIKVQEISTKDVVPLCNITVYAAGKILIQKRTDLDGLAEVEIKDDKPLIISIDMIGLNSIDTLINPKTLKTQQLTINIEEDTSIFDYRTIYNASTAIDDLKKGNVKILFVGLIFIEDLKKINNCCKKFGFEYTFTTDVVNVQENLNEAIFNYNSEVIKYLDILNNKGWKEQLKTRCNINL